MYPRLDMFCVSIKPVNAFNLQYIIKLIEYWPLTIFYVLSEIMMWIIINVLFWQLINAATNTVNAKKFYPLYAIFGHFGVLCGSSIVRFIRGSYKGDSSVIFNDYVITLTFIIVIIFLISYFLFAKITDYAKKNTMQIEVRSKLSVRESLKYVSNSQYFILIFLMIVGFGIQNNLLAILMKKYIEISFKDNPIELSAFSAKFYFLVSFLTIVFSFAFHFIMKRCTWFSVNILAFLMLFIIFIIYFIRVLEMEDMELKDGAILIVLNTLCIQQLLSRVIKGSIIDPAKEMLYIPLEGEIRNKGQAAVEIMGMSVTKSLSSAFIIFILTFSSLESINDISIYICAISGFSLLIWVFTIYKINKLYKKQLRKSGD